MSEEIKERREGLYNLAIRTLTEYEREYGEAYIIIRKNVLTKIFKKIIELKEGIENAGVIIK